MELKVIIKGEIVKGVAEVFVFLGMDPTIFIIMITYVLMGNVLTAEKAFVTKMFLELLEKPMNGFPEALAELAEVRISVKRLQTFLALDEYQPPNPVIDESSEDVCKLSPSSSEVVGPKGVTMDLNTATWKTRQKMLGLPMVYLYGDGSSNNGGRPEKLEATSWTPARLAARDVMAARRLT
ncbi:PREDICTED: uncharacterized protein LOC109464160 [Branchiostoma belcheri]|uniref:Uncharacterized protein LOC109464160 n=1 Tax=Branchiostoma belcheri TaxID=7741 RepID=A0A6P4YD34_BRABE|nr:PREDICTED: uncharacterized protein LOC109464160 [Branchiostoma belcheri]